MDQCMGMCSSRGQAFDRDQLLRQKILDRNCGQETMGEALCQQLELDEKDLGPWKLRAYARIPRCGYGWEKAGYRFKSKLCCSNLGHWDPNNKKDCPGYSLVH